MIQWYENIGLHDECQAEPTRPVSLFLRSGDIVNVSAAIDAQWKHIGDDTDVIRWRYTDTKPAATLKADHYLSQAAAEMKDRAALRDAPDGERSMGKAVAAFNALYGHAVTETQGWQLMALLKMARSSQGKYSEDDYTDEVAYAALAAESAAREESNDGE